MRARIGFIALLLVGAVLSIAFAQPGPAGNAAPGAVGTNGNQGNQGNGPNGPTMVRRGPKNQCDYGHSMNNKGSCQECAIGCVECSWDQHGHGSCNQCEKDICLHSDGSCVMDTDCGDGWSCGGGNCMQCNDEKMFGQGCTSCDRQWCHECDDSHVMDRWGKSCKPQCDDGEFEEDGKCHPCPPGCKKCISADICLVCFDNDFDPTTGCSTCLCGDSIVVFASWMKQPECVPCSELFGEGCSTCCPERCLSCVSTLQAVVTSGGQSNCTLCSDIGGEGCLACSGSQCFNCDEGFFLGADGQCHACTIPSCEDCSSATQCTDCEEPLVVSPANGGCVLCTEIGGSGCLECTSAGCLVCADGFFLQSDSVTTCAACDASCLTCSAAGPQYCTSCKPGFFLYQGQCKECNPACETCIGPNDDQCLSCDQDTGGPFVLSSGSCELCQSLFDGCSVCGENVCILCQEGFYLKDNGDGTTSCVACPFKNCADCTADACTECIDDHFVFSSTGVGGISAGSCVPCSFVYGSHCSTCTSTQCTGCFTEFFYPAPNGLQCLHCSDTYGFDCTNCDKDECTGCTPGTFLQKPGVADPTGQNPPCKACAAQYSQKCILCSDLHCLACNQPGLNPFATPACS